MPRPTHRHRRKAGSGPPAAALIAWIGTDSQRCSTTNSVYQADLPPPASSRPVRNVAASVALACGAVLAVAVGTTEVVLGPPEATTPQALPQDHLTYPGDTTYPGPDPTGPNPTGSYQAAPPVAAQQVDPDPVTSPAPAAAHPPVVRQAPQSTPVPPASKQVAEPAAASRQPAAVQPEAQPQVAAPRVTAPRDRTQREASSQPRITKKPNAARTSPSTRRPSSNPPSGRGDRPSLGSTLNRTTGSLESTLGLR